MHGSLGQIIRELRRKRGLTQQDLAGPDLSKSYISQLERDLVRPSLDSLRLIAQRLDVSLAELVAQVDPNGAAYRALLLASALRAVGEFRAAWAKLQLESKVMV